MEAYDQRYDVAVYSTIERPEFLLYVILFGIVVGTQHSLSKTTMETPFSKAQGHSKLYTCSLFTSLLNFRSGFLRMSSKLSLVQSQLSALSLPWYFFFLSVFVLINLCIYFTVLNRVLGSSSGRFRTYANL